MKIVIVNGSARRGNTLAAIEAFSESAKLKLLRGSEKEIRK